MNNTNNLEQRKLFVYTIIISILTTASVFLPLFFGISGYDVVPSKVDFGISSMLFNYKNTVFGDYNYMICMVIAGWPILAFGLASTAISLITFIKNDENQTVVYKKLNLGCLICSLTYSLFGIIDMIVGMTFKSYVLPLSWIYSIPVVALYIGFLRHNANCVEGASVATSKKSKIVVLSTVIASAVVVSLTLGLSFGLGHDDTKAIRVVENGIVYEGGYSSSKYTTSTYGGGEFGYVVVGAENITDETLVIPNKINGLRVVKIEEHALEKLPCKEILLPGSIYTIEPYAFQDCPNLEKVVAPVNTIQNSAFSNCLSLETVTTNAYDIGNYAFSGCLNLKTVTAKNVKTIGDGAFGGCTNLVNFTFPDTLESIGNSAFNNTAITNLSLVNSHVKIIGAYAFENCDSLVTVQLDRELRTIEEHAFYDCDNLVSVSLGWSFVGSGAQTVPSISEIKDNAFGNCNKLAFITYNGYDSDAAADAIIILPTTIKEFSGINGTIFYMGSKTEWSNINATNISGKVYYYSYSNPYENNPDDKDLYWHFVECVPVIWTNTPQETE